MLVHDLLKKNLRMDGRSPGQFRSISFVHFADHLVVQSASSYVYIFFSKTPCKPLPDRPSEGILQITLEKGRKSDVLLNFLHKIYTKSRCLSMSDLCVTFNQEVYLISIDICPVQTDGDVFRLSVAGINEVIKTLGLKVFFTPTYLGYCSIEDTLVADPDEHELLNSKWSMSAVMKSTREVLCVEKVGEGVSQNEILGALDRAFADARMMSGHQQCSQ